MGKTQEKESNRGVKQRTEQHEFYRNWCLEQRNANNINNLLLCTKHGCLE